MHLKEVERALDDRADGAYLKAEIFGDSLDQKKPDYPEYRSRLLEVIDRSKNITWFADEYFAEFGYTHQSAVVLKKLHEYSIWKILRALMGERCIKTDSDIASLSVGDAAGAFRLNIPNLEGDGTTRFCFNAEHGNFIADVCVCTAFFELKTSGVVYSGDCDDEICAELPAGRYWAYSHDGLVFIQPVECWR